jgi:hypothetical protein
MQVQRVRYTHTTHTHICTHNSLSHTRANTHSHTLTHTRRPVCCAPSSASAKSAKTPTTRPNHGSRATTRPPQPQQKITVRPLAPMKKNDIHIMIHTCTQRRRVGRLPLRVTRAARTAAAANVSVGVSLRCSQPPRLSATWRTAAAAAITAAAARAAR